jgi:hypothetical protein
VERLGRLGRFVKAGSGDEGGFLPFLTLCYATPVTETTEVDMGLLVNESTQAIAPSGPAATEFHISKPGGWPAGKYKVQVSSNGSAAGAKDFEVGG